MGKLRYPLGEIEKDAFSALCLAVLQYSISPAVRQISRAGKDGGRDAVLDGPCSTDRYPPKISSWIFQFKQYESDTSKTRSQALADFKREAACVLSKSKPRAYIFLASVSFSGVPDSGLFDRVEAERKRLSSTYSALVEFWDGIHICSIIDEKPKRFNHFFVPQRIERFAPSSLEAQISGPGLSETLLDLVEAPDFDLSPSWFDLLFPLNELLLGPDGKSPLWKLVEEGRFERLSRIARRLIYILERQSEHHKPGTPAGYSFLWSQILFAWSLGHRGFLSEAHEILGKLTARYATLLPSEPLAWIYNVRSIVAGKQGEEVNAVKLGQRCIEISKAIGNYWLASIVGIRLIHRRDWHAWEHGQSPNKEIFEERLAQAAQSLQHASGPASTHANAAKAAAQALHYSWDTLFREMAADAATRALRLLRNQPDHEERARMVSELGRIRLLSEGDLVEAKQSLVEAAILRASSGNVARLRYDLAWLAELYLKSDERTAADLAYRAALALHKKFYGSHSGDKGLLRNLANIGKQLSVDTSSMPQDSPSYLVKRLDLLEDCTGVNAVWWEHILKVSR